MTNSCCTYDFTIFAVDELDPPTIRNTLKEICKKYTFQLEQGELTGKLHYQGRLSLKCKKRQSELIKLLDQAGWTKYHLSITSNENRDNNFYVTKEETRIQGPFTDTNEIYVPRDIRNIKELRPWQQKLRTTLQSYDERSIDIIVDTKGNSGKSTLTRYMMLFDNAQVLPFCNDYKDIMRMAYDVGIKPIYLIDMPRAINKEKLFQFYAGIETLKSGYCYDDRYKFTQRLFDRPRICIFTNVHPDTSLLSRDMWKIWSIVDNQLILLNDDTPSPPGNHVVINNNKPTTEAPLLTGVTVLVDNIASPRIQSETPLFTDITDAEMDAILTGTNE